MRRYHDIVRALLNYYRRFLIFFFFFVYLSSIVTRGFYGIKYSARQRSRGLNVNNMVKKCSSVKKKTISLANRIRYYYYYYCCIVSTGARTVYPSRYVVFLWFFHEKICRWFYLESHDRRGGKLMKIRSAEEKWSIFNAKTTCARYGRRLLLRVHVVDRRLHV